MQPSNSNPPKLAQCILNLWLPDRVKNEIAGDLIEEFYRSDEPLLTRTLKFWQQTFFACWSYPMNRNIILSLCCTVFSLLLVYVLIRSMVFLAISNDPLFYKDYWLNGNVHMFIIEPAFWSNLYDTNNLKLEWHMLINSPGIIWSVLALSCLYWCDQKRNLTKPNYVVAALATLLAPYIYGCLQLKLNDLPLNQVGPIIAYMWSSIMYLAIPLCVLTIKKIHTQNNMIQV